MVNNQFDLKIYRFANLCPTLVVIAMINVVCLLIFQKLSGSCFLLFSPFSLHHLSLSIFTPLYTTSNQRCLCRIIIQSLAHCEKLNR